MGKVKREQAKQEWLLFVQDRAHHVQSLNSLLTGHFVDNIAAVILTRSRSSAAMSYQRRLVVDVFVYAIQEARQKVMKLSRTQEKWVGDVL